jgi:hypothetical protein
MSDGNKDDTTRMSDTLMREVAAVRRLREDVLLLRFHLARRTDMAKIIDPADRLVSEAALASSLEVLENADRGVLLPAGHITAASAALLDAVDKLVTASRLAQEQDGTGEEPFPVTPESLRACLPEDDIARALGAPVPGDGKKRKTANEAKSFLIKSCVWTVVYFFIALLVHGLTIIAKQLPGFTLFGLPLSGDSTTLKNIAIPFSAFVWALVGSRVWILIRFRRFGASYSFDPAQAEVLEARVLSGSVTTAVILYLVFGGGEEEAWAKHWVENLPLWGFVLGYAGKLQVELIRKMVDYVQNAISKLPATAGKGREKPADHRGSATGAARNPASRSAIAGLAREPEVRDVEGEPSPAEPLPSGKKG